MDIFLLNFDEAMYIMDHEIENSVHFLVMIMHSRNLEELLILNLLVHLIFRYLLSLIGCVSA